MTLSNFIKYWDVLQTAHEKWTTGWRVLLAWVIYYLLLYYWSYAGKLDKKGGSNDQKDTI